MSLNNKLEELEKARKEAETIAKLRERFPDLDVQEDRWRQQRYYSKEVNALADKVDFRFSCGCCNDSPMIARPYTEVDGTRIYCNPARGFMIGEQYDYTHTVEIPGWEDKVRDAGLSDAIMQQIHDFLVREAPPLLTFEDMVPEDVQEKVTAYFHQIMKEEGHPTRMIHTPISNVSTASRPAKTVRVPIKNRGDLYE